MQNAAHNIISYTVFYRGYTKIYWVHEKSCIGRGEAEPNTTFFMDPIYFRIPPVKHCVTNLSHQRPFFKYSFSPNTTYQISVYICHGPFLRIIFVIARSDISN